MKITSRKLRSGKIVSTDTLNYISHEFNNNLFSKEFVFDTRLYADNRERFKNIFGEYDFRYKGEHISDVWVVSHDAQTYLIFSAGVRGTSIEVVDNGNVDKAKVEGFIAYVANKLNELNKKEA